ncbi:hypothetical protein [Actinomadura fibrosa]|uniref:Uncharacterized protein n=1 Tax=Actinomadura fibrosa TaxID=111802 RepID=A0ABW2Y3R1_9ACTN|nr:hypothetical protein [Actinomadura fibrosa]
MRELANRLLRSLDKERPRYGYGRGGGPLWDERSRDAEGIRRVLRKAEFQEFGDNGSGFAVETDSETEGGPFLVSAAVSSDEDVRAVIAAYTRALTAQGWRVEPDSGPDFQPGIIEVTITSR